MSALKNNIGYVHGAWGERVACDMLRLKGYQIIDRNSRPYSWDHRLEIDIVAYDAAQDTLIFVEVKQHKSRSLYQQRLRSINKSKCRNMKIVCNAWRRRYHWEGGYRFDVMEIYGTPEQDMPEVDYIENVNIFTPKERSVDWK